MRPRPLPRPHWQLPGRRRAGNCARCDVWDDHCGRCPCCRPADGGGGRQPVPEAQPPARRPEPYTPPLTGWLLVKLRDILQREPSFSPAAHQNGAALADLLRRRCPEPDEVIARFVLVILDYANGCQAVAEESPDCDADIIFTCAMAMAAVDLTALDRVP